MNQSPKKLYRSKNDQVIAGVCSGLANYFEIDPTIVRIIFVVLAFAGGTGVFIYLALLLIVPAQDSAAASAKETIRQNAEELKATVKNAADNVKRPEYGQDRGAIWWGAILLLVGTYFLLLNFNIIAQINFGRLWPILLVVLGLVILVRRK